MFDSITAFLPRDQQVHWPQTVQGINYPIAGKQWALILASDFANRSQEALRHTLIMWWNFHLRLQTSNDFPCKTCQSDNIFLFVCLCFVLHQHLIGQFQRWDVQLLRLNQTFYWIFSANWCDGAAQWLGFHERSRFYSPNFAFFNVDFIHNVSSLVTNNYEMN